MAKSVPISVVDALLDKIAVATLQVACSNEPMSRDDAINAFNLATVILASGDFAKETLAGKRNLLIAAKADVVVENSGSVSHIALCDSSSVLAVTTVNADYLSSGGQYSFPAWAVTVSVA